MTTDRQPALSPSVTSLTSADIDPHLLRRSESPMPPPQPPPPPMAPTLSSGVEPDAGDGIKRGEASRISMRRNTVPLVRQDALRNGAPTDSTAVAAASSSRSGRAHQQVCRYCLRLFDDRHNPKGACPEAPDQVKTCIDRLTCLTLADGVSYHCCADDEGDYIKPCQLRSGRRRARSNDNAADDGSNNAVEPARRYAASLTDRSKGDDFDDDENDENGDDDTDGARSTLLDRLKSWSCVCLLALFVPCLCCYPVCSMAHQASKRLHLAGGQHAALWTDTRPQQPAGASRGGVKKDPTRNTIAGLVAVDEAATADFADGANASMA